MIDGERGHDYRVLGPVEVCDAAGVPLALGGAQRRAVLAQLALAPGRVVSVDALCAGLWGERLPPTAVKAVHVHISKLRAVLPAGALVTRPPGYLLDVDPLDTDAGRFEAALGRARATAGGDPAAVARALRQALDLWRGPALSDVADHPFAAAAVARLEEARALAVEERLAAELELGHHASAVGDLEAAVRDEPLRERRWALLMVALYRCGRQAEALDAFSRARNHLVGELGLEPGPDLRALERAVLDHAVPEPGAARRGRSARPGRLAPPRPPAGLRMPAVVVGRDEALATVAGAVARSVDGSGSAVSVRGDEGMGKSALLAAVARSAADHAWVVAGRCREHVEVPYGPWTEVVAQLGADGAQARLAGPGDDGDTPERHRVRTFEEVAAAIRVAAYDQPVVLLFDDLHWSDEATVDLLLHAIDELRDSAAVFVLAWRPREVGPGHPVARLQPLLDRAGAPAVDLGPLAQADIAALLAFGGQRPDADERAATATRVHDLTGGVPLFATEVLTTLAAGRGVPEAGDLPETLRTLVARRLADAGPVARAVAEAAAVVDEPMDVEVLASLLPDRTPFEVVEGLDRLVDLGLLVEVPDGHAFVHGAFGRSILAGLRSGRRQTLHATAFRALEGRGTEPTVLIHHGDAAGALVPAAEVLDHVRATADEAVRRGAFADAHLSFARLARECSPADRAARLVDDAECLGRSGDLGGMKQVALAALGAAREHGAADEVVTRAVEQICVFGDGFGIDAEAIRAAEGALSLVVGTNVRAELATIRAYHHAMWGSPFAIARSALAEARRYWPDPPSSELEGGFLFAEGLALLGSPDLARRDRLVERLLSLEDDLAAHHRGRALRLRCLTEMSAGRLDALAGTLDELLETAGEVGSWLYRSDALRWGIAATIATGDRAEARRAIDELEEVSASPLAGRAFVGTQRMVLHWFGGELGSCLAYLDAMLSVLPADDPVGTDHRLATLIRLTAQLEAGQRDEVAAAFATLDPVRDLDRSSCRRYPAELALCAGLVAELGLANEVDELVARLTPFAGQLLVLSWGECLVGSADGYLAGLASVRAGSVDDDAFARAVELEERLGDHMSAQRTRARWDRAR